jgi:hypothetical protein
LAGRWSSVVPYIAKSLEALDAPAGPFQRLTELACTVFDAPAAVVTLVNGDNAVLPTTESGLPLPSRGVSPRARRPQSADEPQRARRRVALGERGVVHVLMARRRELADSERAVLK